ncbi:MAG: lysophospholipid acyltransferase family protein [Pseudomonadota bacterium]
MTAETPPPIAPTASTPPNAALLASNKTAAGELQSLALPAARSDRPVTLSHRIEYALTRLAFAALGRMSVDKASSLGGGFLRTIGPLLRPVSKRGEDNLRLIFPDWPEERIHETIKDVWENLGRTAAEYPHLNAFDPSHETPRVTVHISPIVQERRKTGAPSVLISGHFANWEVMPLVLNREGIDYAVIYRPVNNPLVDGLIIELRGEVMSRRMIPKGYDGARDAMKQLSAGRCVAMLADQKLNSGISAPLLGRDAMTPTAAARLALRYNVPVIPSSIVRRDGAHFDVYMRDPIAYESVGHMGTDVQNLTILINEAIGREILAHPEQWLWFHRRWPKEASTS